MRVNLPAGRQARRLSNFNYERDIALAPASISTYSFFASIFFRRNLMNGESSTINIFAI